MKEEKTNIKDRIKGRSWRIGKRRRRRFGAETQLERSAIEGRRRRRKHSATRNGNRKGDVFSLSLRLRLRLMLMLMLMLMLSSCLRWRD